MVMLYDTLARAVVDVAPGDGHTLTMYSCGPTVYRYAHIGNLRTFLMADLIRRAFEYRGTGVTQIQNITDVGHMTDELTDSGRDRMEIAAEVEGRSTEEIAAFYTEAFLADVDAFGIKRAHRYPRASDHIPQMIELIVKLLERRHAYEAEGTVYFDVSSFSGYGRLSGNTLDALQADHRKTIDDPNKRNPADFVLWKAAPPTREVRFRSPWGEGYPGWHIECSAMSIEAFGDRFDLHTGGEDNVFPHHEDEIAQSEGAVGHPVVRHWVHGAHLLAEGRKMSKSVQNVYDVRDLEQRGYRDPLAARLLFLQSRYRAQMNFTLDALRAAETTLSRWRRHVAAWTGAEEGNDALLDKYEQRFADAISTDLDTPAAIALLAEVFSSTDLSPRDKVTLVARWDRVLGLDLARDVGSIVEVDDGARMLVEQRERARTAKDYAEADRLREQLRTHGYDVEDTAAGPELRRR